MTISIENFLKAIYHQCCLPTPDARLSTIAGMLNISNAAATDMARKLASKNLVNYTKYKPLSLTDEGHSLALNVIRKHRLWESFLYQTLNLSLHEIHQEAEQLEHLTSDFLADKIEKYLGHPTTDPHGDPIPNLNGESTEDASLILLSNAKGGESYTVSRLFSTEKDFFDFCNDHAITIGSTIWVEKQYEKQKMTELRIDGDKLLLNRELTEIIYVQPQEN